MSLSKLFDFVKDKFIHLILIIQVFLFLTSVSYYANFNVGLEDIIVIIISISFTIISFIIEIHNYGRRSIIYRFNLLLLTNSIFMILDIYFNQPNNSLALLVMGSIQLFVFLFSLDFILEMYFAKMVRIIKKISKLYMLVMVICLWINEFIFLLLYQSLFILTLIIPMIILLLNIRGLNKYAREIKNNYIKFSLLSLFLFVGAFILNITRLLNVKNLDYYIYITIIVIFLAGIILKSFHINKKEFINILNKSFNKYLLGIMLILTAGFNILGTSSLMINHLIFIFTIVGMECYMIHYRIYKINLAFNPAYEFDSVLAQGLNQLKREEEEKEKIVEYLHEEILQDAIYIKNQLKQKYKLPNDEEVVKISDGIIQSIRSEIDTLLPNIIHDISLKENYYNIIRTLQVKYEDKGIGIEDYYWGCGTIRGRD